ncbi:hypothetical protein CRG98_030895 [Punica granatum]|uniref:Uncharacterized protein n=1 Tax=Punica granatum TaxID=22663 RepID=A0A2I0IXK4_PUNGR|nr:hypothetical protein CRG98_030895 [Punica granatum]
MAWHARFDHGTVQVGSGGHRNAGWFSDDFSRFQPLQGQDGNVGVGWGLRGFWREIGLRERKEEASLELPAKGISRGLGLSCRSRGFEPRLGVEPWLDGSAWLSCGSHSIEGKVGKCLKLD